MDEQSKVKAYQAWLGFYNSFKGKLRWTPEQLVQQANIFSQSIGKPLSRLASQFCVLLQTIC